MSFRKWIEAIHSRSNRRRLDGGLFPNQGCCCCVKPFAGEEGSDREKKSCCVDAGSDSMGFQQDFPQARQAPVCVCVCACMRAAGSLCKEYGLDLVLTPNLSNFPASVVVLLLLLLLVVVVVVVVVLLNDIDGNDIGSVGALSIVCFPALLSRITIFRGAGSVDKHKQATREKEREREIDEGGDQGMHAQIAH